MALVWSKEKISHTWQLFAEPPLNSRVGGRSQTVVSSAFWSFPLQNSLTGAVQFSIFCPQRGEGIITICLSAAVFYILRTPSSQFHLFPKPGVGSFMNQAGLRALPLLSAFSDWALSGLKCNMQRQQGLSWSTLSNNTLWGRRIISHLVGSTYGFVLHRCDAFLLWNSRALAESSPACDPALSLRFPCWLLSSSATKV